MDSVRQGLTLAEAVDVIGPRPVSERPLFDTTFQNILSIGIGFVLEALEKRGLKLATTLLTQMVGMDVCVCACGCVHCMRVCVCVCVCV